MPLPPLAQALRVLHLEDSVADHELMLAHLRRGGIEVRSLRVDSEAAFLAALQQHWDIVLSDFNLPGFSGLLALDLLRASGRDIPFILVSGEIGEDTAVEAMRNGASDYLLKHDLGRLAPAIEHAERGVIVTPHARQVWLSYTQPGTPDGMRADIDGNLWCGWGMGREGLDGVSVFNPDGKLIGRIDLPERCANVCFGGQKRNRLFITASQSLYSVYVNTRGAHHC